MNRAQLLEALRAKKPVLFENGGEVFVEALSDRELASLLSVAEADAAAEERPSRRSSSSWFQEAKAKGSLDDRVNCVRDAVRKKYQAALPDAYVYAEVVFEDYVIVRKGDDLFRLDYTLTDDGVQFTGEPTKVRVAYVPVKEARVAADGYFAGRVLEAAGAAPATSGREWDAVIIESGLSQNRVLYSPEVLESALAKYEGAKIYLDHQEEPRRFGRSTKDCVGFFRDVRPAFLFREATGPGTYAICGTACITKKSVREELVEAAEMGNTSLFGFSHDIRAKHQSFIADDQQAAIRIEAINKVVSVDLVTEPAAGGRLTRIVASDTPAHSLQEDGKMLERLLAKLRSLNRPDLVESLGQNPTEDQVVEAIAKALAAAPASSTPPSTAAATAAASTAATAIAEARDSRLTDADLATVRESRTIIANLYVDRDLRDCALPDKLKERLRARFQARIKEGRIPAEAEIAAEIREAVEDYGALAEAGVVMPHVAAGTPRIEMGAGPSDKVKTRLDEFFDPAKPARSFREAYVEITGDTRITGRIDQSPRIRESLNSSSFDQALGDSITRRMLAYYAAPEFANWRLIARTSSLNDFRTQRRIRFGGYGNLPTVTEGAVYGSLTSPTDEEATYAPAKRGGTESVTLEMIRNDDVNAIREIPLRLGRAAAQTLYEFVWDFLANNSTIYDSVALAAVGHSNIVTTALSPSNVASLRLKMKNQTDMSNSKRLGLRAKYLIVPNDLEELAFQIVRSLRALPDTSIASTAEPAAPNFLNSERVRLDPIVVDYWTDTNNYWLGASPDQTPMIEVGFMDGREDPELFVQDMPNVGSMFANDSLTWKIRHIYGGAVLDFRGFGAGIVA